MEQVLMFATILMPTITAVVEVIKRAFCLPKNVIPAISLGVGLIIGGLAYPFTDMDLILRLWAGGYAGLSGTGLFELVKKRNGFTKEK
ncbi:holin [Ornithinibacillus sp. L9]|uniref:Holin n=1 Tax=Ornithinibacillus caprae TaxID=2678566 RepID=A0A6N8FMD6_9BACI|nr:holin [Ornithinibacillus caprae]MUK88488.1 holin [Ornithinibacillus caprae]